MAAADERRNQGDLAADHVLEAVTETSDDAIILVGRQRGVTSWGSTAERLFGVHPSEAVGRPLDQLFSPHLQERLRSAVDRAMAGEHVIHFETEALRADGLPFPIWVSLCPLSDVRGNPWGIVAIATDVTEQHLAQAALAEVEGRLRYAEALSHVGSWLWDLRTGAVQWSTEYYRIHAVDPFEFDGTLSSHLDKVHPDDRQMIRKLMEESVELARPFECECRILRSDGEVRLLMERAHPSVASDGSVIGLRGIGQDMTEFQTEDRPGSDEHEKGGSVVGDEIPHPIDDVVFGAD